MLTLNTLLQDRYFIEEEIGRGGMGSVYRAIDNRLGHTVAIKQIRHDGPVEKQAFEQEARILAHLRHPALPKVTDYFIADNCHFLVMEFVPGEDLAQLAAAREEPFPLSQVLAWADKLLDALTYLHAQQPPIIHRDIKPHNIKLTEQGDPILLDFGLAKGLAGPTGLNLSVPGYTLAYAPPEQIRGLGTDTRSDLYSLAATLVDLLTGSRPPDAISRLMATQGGEPDPLSPQLTVRSDLPVSVEAALQKALALEPIDRFTTAEKMQQALQGTAPVTDEEAVTEGVLTEEATVPVTALPFPSPSLVGREKALTAVKVLLNEEAVRLVTITGPGGVGKTRMALAVASTATTDFPDGLFFINLAPILDPALVLSAIAQRLDAKEPGQQPLVDSLAQAIGSKKMLLILDNFEQVIPAASLVASLLAACPRLKILITSREILRIRWEREYALPSLAVPDPYRILSLEEISQYSAVQLFVERVRSFRQGFNLDENNAQAIAEICIQLDGLPLAIELAAARLKILSPTQILDRLDGRFRLLRDGARDLPERQQTLQAAIDWSYDLLVPAEQQLFRRMSIFVGGRTLEAIEAVCDPRDSNHLAPLAIDVLDGLTSLIDKSLVRRLEAIDGQLRFTMLVTIHAYASARLAESGELPHLAQQHALYYTNLAETADEAIKETADAETLSKLEAEHDNLRLALRRTLEGNNADLALRLAAALWRFWDMHGHFSDGRRWLKEVLTTSTRQSETRGKALLGASVLAMRQGDYEAAYAHVREGLAIFRAARHKGGEADSLNMLANLALYEGDYAKAQPLYEESLSILRELGNQQREAVTLGNLGIVTAEQGDYAAARKYLEASLILCRDLKQHRAVAESLHNLGEVTSRQGDYAAARKYLEESLSMRRDMGDKWGISYSLHNLGQIAYYQGDFETAASLLQESLRIKQDLGEQWGEAYVLFDIGEMALRQGKLVQALSHYQSSLRLRRDVEDRPGIEACLRSIAAVLEKEWPHIAATILGALAGNFANSASLESPDAQSFKMALQQTIGDETFAKKWSEGNKLSLSEAIALALTLAIEKQAD